MSIEKLNPGEIDGDIHLQDDADLDESGPTSTVNPDEPQGEEETDPEETPEDKSESGSDDFDWESDDNPFKKRYSDSAKEVQETLLPKIKTLEAEKLTESQKAAKLQADLDEAMSKLREEQPEAYDNLTLRKQAETNARELAELKEEQKLDRFTAKTPDAEAYREALRSHSRANPNKSLDEIWNDSFKDVVEAKKVLAQDKDKNLKGTKPHKGSGPTRELGKTTIAGYSEEEFNKLPWETRREHLIKQGITL